MDFVKLDSDYNPNDLIEGYSSLIWTERYTKAGEFQLKTSNLGLKDTLPLKSAVSLLDTDRVQIVETHAIAHDDNGKAELTITGRDYESVLEGRIAAKSLAALPNNWHITDETPAQMVSDIIRNAITTSPISPKDTIPWVDVVNQAPPDDLDDYVVEMTDAYSQVVDLLTAAGLGIRSVKRSGGFGIDIPGLDMIIFKGTDRSIAQNTRPKIVMSLDAGHLSSSDYVFTTSGVRNIAYVYSKLGTRIVSAAGISLNISGIDRQVLLVKADDIEQKTPTPYTATQLDRILRRRGLRALAEAAHPVLFDAEVTELNPYKYNKDYFLGDKITVQADYNVQRNVIIKEYVRIEDEQGERAYPTLFPDS